MLVRPLSLGRSHAVKTGWASAEAVSGLRAAIGMSAGCRLALPLSQSAGGVEVRGIGCRLPGRALPRKQSAEGLKCCAIGSLLPGVCASAEAVSYWLVRPVSLRPSSVLSRPEGCFRGSVPVGFGWPSGCQLALPRRQSAVGLKWRAIGYRLPGVGASAEAVHLGFGRRSGFQLTHGYFHQSSPGSGLLGGCPMFFSSPEEFSSPIPGPSQMRQSDHFAT
jgi:hypothetical protein